MDLVEPVEALGEQDLDLLDIALRPTAVARGEVDHGWRGFLVAADDVAGDFDAPAGAAEQGGFDKVVTQDLAAQRFLARKVREARMSSEGREADDGVVAPEIARAARPPGQAGAEQAAMYAQCKLLAARRIGAGADDDRQRLDQGRPRAGVHATHQFEHRFWRNERVGVELEHVLIAAAPALDEIVDVALLLLGVLAAAAIPERLVGTAAHKLLDRLFLDFGEGGVHRVAYEKDLEAFLGAEVFQRVPHRLGGGDHLRRLFLVERDDDGGEVALGRKFLRRRGRPRRGQQN